MKNKKLLFFLEQGVDIVRLQRMCFTAKNSLRGSYRQSGRKGGMCMFPIFIV